MSGVWTARPLRSELAPEFYVLHARCRYCHDDIVAVGRDDRLCRDLTWSHLTDDQGAHCAAAHQVEDQGLPEGLSPGAG